MSKVLLTGITGFLGSHTAIQLLDRGYEVVGSMRNLQRADAIRKIIASHTTASINRLQFVQADLTNADAWHTAVQGVDYVQHVASPLPRVLPKHDDELVIPAREGSLNVLRAAAAAGVKRVIQTSSAATMMYGVTKQKTFDENDWTDETNRKDTTPYFRSKTIAEKAAWQFMKEDNSGLELTVVNPVLILGPVLEKDYGTSAELIKKLLDGSMPALPKMSFALVDVRSVADALIKAMETPEAAGHRFAIGNSFMALQEIANTLRAAYPNKKIPKASLPDFAVKLFALIDKEVQTVLPELGAERRIDSSKAREMLNWQPLDDKQSILDTAQSLFIHEVVL